MTIKTVTLAVDYVFDTETRRFANGGDGFTKVFHRPLAFPANTREAMERYLANNPKFLPVPEEGRKVKATLRNGDRVTFVAKPRRRFRGDMYIAYDHPQGGVVFLPDTKGDAPDGHDIVAWEYVPEWTVVPGAVSDAFNAMDPEGVLKGSFTDKADAEAFVAMKNGGTE